MVELKRVVSVDKNNKYRRRHTHFSARRTSPVDLTCLTSTFTRGVWNCGLPPHACSRIDMSIISMIITRIPNGLDLILRDKGVSSCLYQNYTATHSLFVISVELGDIRL